MYIYQQHVGVNLTLSILLFLAGPSKATQYSECLYIYNSIHVAVYVLKWNSKQSYRSTKTTCTDCIDIFQIDSDLYF